MTPILARSSNVEMISAITAIVLAAAASVTALTGFLTALHRRGAENRGNPPDESLGRPRGRGPSPTPPSQRWSGGIRPRTPPHPSTPVAATPWYVLRGRPSTNRWSTATAEIAAPSEPPPDDPPNRWWRPPVRRPVPASTSSERG